MAWLAGESGGQIAHAEAAVIGGQGVSVELGGTGLLRRGRHTGFPSACRHFTSLRGHRGMSPSLEECLPRTLEERQQEKKTTQYYVFILFNDLTCPGKSASPSLQGEKAGGASSLTVAPPSSGDTRWRRGL
jgi:hypothetical protein